MSNEKIPYSVGWRIPRSLHAILVSRKEPRQSLAGVVENILTEIDELRKYHEPLIDTISNLRNELDYFKHQEITPELLKTLEKRKHPGQTVGGVIEELLALAKQIERSEIKLHTQIGRDM